MVNVNINERSARRSDVLTANTTSTHSGSEYSGAGQFSSLLPKYGALQKLRGETDEDDSSGSGASETKATKHLSAEARNNSTVNVFAGFAFPKPNQVNIVNIGNGMSDNYADDDDEDSDESGSTDSLLEAAMSLKTESDKGTEEKTKTAAGNTNDNPSNSSRKQQMKKPDIQRKYKPDTENAENVKSLETGSKAPAESVTAVKQSKEFNKENREEIKSTEKLTSFSKPLGAETEEMAHNVKSGHLKTPLAEDVRIEQVKDKTKKPKEIPKEAAIVKKVPEQPNMKVASNKEVEQNEEILFTKQEKREKNKEIMKDNVNTVKKKENSDDKYETLEEVRQKFKNWENHLESKNNADHAEPKTKDVDTKDSVAKTEKNKDQAPEKIHGVRNLKEKSSSKNEKITSDDLKSLSDKDEKKEETGKEAKEQKSSSLKEKTGKQTPDTSEIPEETSSWKEEEKALLQKLKNPYVDKTSEFKKNNEKEDEENEEDEAELAKKEKEAEQEAVEIKKNANAEFATVVNKVTSSNTAKSIEMEAEEKEAADVKASADKAFTAVVDKVTKPSPDNEQQSITGNKDATSKPAKRVGELGSNATTDTKGNLANQNIKQLQTFKDQILAEVAKIENLQSEYGTDEHSTKDLSEAKDVLEKDLKVVKELENNLIKKAAKNTNAPQQSEKAVQGKSNTVLPDPEKSVEDDEVIPDAKLGFEEKPKKVLPRKKKVKFDDTTSYEYAYYTNKKPIEKRKPKKNHPIEEIHSLLRAEIKRLRLKPGGKQDKQLSNIRKLVQNRLKTLISTGELDKTTFHTLTPAIKELGRLLKSRINREKKKRLKKKIKNVKSGRVSNKAVEVMKSVSTNRKPLDSFNKPAKVNQGAMSYLVDKQLNKMNKDVSKVKPAASQNTPSSQSSNSMSPQDLQQATQHVSNAQDVFTKVQNNNISLDPSQSSKMKNLLQTLNQKLGEIYSKAQGVSTQNQPYQTSYTSPNVTANYQQPRSQPPDSIPNVYIPSTYINTKGQVSPSYSFQSPQNMYNQPAQGMYRPYLKLFKYICVRWGSVC